MRPLFIGPPKLPAVPDRDIHQESHSCKEAMILAILQPSAY
jgi:hypothetical protein